MSSNLKVNSIVPAVGSNVAIGTAGGTISCSAPVSGITTFSDGVNVTSGNVTVGLTTITSSSITSSSLTVNGNNYPDTGPLSNRNLIINGAMQIAQRGTSFSTNNARNYGVDRFACNASANTTITYSQETDAPAGFTNSLKATITSANSSRTAGDLNYVLQPIEGNNFAHLNFGSADAKTFTLSFYVKSSVPGTYGIGFVNNGSTRIYQTTYTINSANWERKTITIPGDTSGTWLTNNGIGLTILWDLGLGTNYESSTINTWSGTVAYRQSSDVNLSLNASATWQITGVQLEAGNIATPFEHRSFGDELARCMRYYEHSSDYADSSWKTRDWAYAGQGLTRAQANGYADYFAQFTVPKRSTPNVTYYSATGVQGNVAWEKPGVTNDTNVVPSNLGTTVNRQIFRIRAGNVSQDAWLYCNWEANAEL